MSTTVLGALEQEAWQQLLEKQGLSETEVKWIDDVAGRLPFYSQLAAAMIWQHGSLELAQQAFEKEATRRFKELWAELTEMEELVLTQAVDGKVWSASMPVVNELKEHGLLRSDNRMVSQSFLAFIAQQK